MTKYSRNLRVVSCTMCGPRCCSLVLTDDVPLPDILPGQFVTLHFEDTPHTFLRRPISVHDVDRTDNTLHLLVQVVGGGTRRMAALTPGEKVDVVFPLGNGFTTDVRAGQRILLVGGGIGAAPLLYLARCLRAAGVQPDMLIGARSAGDFVPLDAYRQYGTVYQTTEDGSAGVKGYVTDHPRLKEVHYDLVCTCGPKPMMMSVARYARQTGTECEVSLENTMACGIGACLCCVEKTDKGHVCVCTEGPVFNINRLTWQI